MPHCQLPVPMFLRRHPRHCARSLTQAELKWMPTTISEDHFPSRSERPSFDRVRGLLLQIVGIMVKQSHGSHGVL